MLLLTSCVVIIVCLLWLRKRYYCYCYYALLRITGSTSTTIIIYYSCYCCCYFRFRCHFWFRVLGASRFQRLAPSRTGVAAVRPIRIVRIHVVRAPGSRYSGISLCLGKCHPSNRRVGSESNPQIFRFSRELGMTHTARRDPVGGSRGGRRCVPALPSAAAFGDTDKSAPQVHAHR